ncbi:MAG: hypothetical protein HY646_00810 [Acidobacteria bacterium]|nr:hypothetical protein [Acidobacteriota bacterium]
MKINNHAELVKTEGSHTWFDWEVFIDEDQSKLEQIDHVTYFLHPTFPDPVRTVRNPENRFALKSRGWGEFDVGVRIVYKDGRSEKLTYSLDLSKP